MGKTFGRWTVIERAQRPAGLKTEGAYWLCQCECGIQKIVNSSLLIRGASKSCGCYQKEHTSQGRFINLLNQRFDRLLVIRLDGTGKQGARWECVCDCGNIVVTSSYSLRRGQTRSCGCYQIEQTRNAARIEYGESAFNLLLGAYKKGAKKRGLEFSLSKEMFREITKQNCFYCGKEPSQIMSNKCNNGDYIYNGIDRIDSNLGYVDNNVVPCCYTCNFMKGSMKYADFYNAIIQIYNNLGDKNVPSQF
jgi:hypothetical protein